MLTKSHGTQNQLGNKLSSIEEARGKGAQFQTIGGDSSGYKESAINHESSIDSSLTGMSGIVGQPQPNTVARNFMSKLMKDNDPNDSNYDETLGQSPILKT